MQFGLFMMPLHPPHRAFADGYDRDVAQIVLADRLGFREVWVGEQPDRALGERAGARSPARPGRWRSRRRCGSGRA